MCKHYHGQRGNGTAGDHARAKKRYLACIKTTRGCERCGLKGKPSRVYDFHHRDPSTKTVPMHRLPHDVGWDRIDTEVAKCDVLCANCHREVELETDSD